MTSHTQRTLKELRRQGCMCAIAERWIPNPKHPGGGFRKDLFGFIDVLALTPRGRILAVQSCGSSFSEHRRKLFGECRDVVAEWLNCGGLVELWGWRKVVKERGSKVRIWRPRVERITAETLKEV